MKKKLLAAIAAGAMLCGMLTAPVSAAETYQKGDVNMDGVVDVADAQLALVDYVEGLCGRRSELTDEQRNLGNVTEKTEIISMPVSQTEFELVIGIIDAQLILRYYTEHLLDETLTMDDFLKANLK